MFVHLATSVHTTLSLFSLFTICQRGKARMRSRDSRQQTRNTLLTVTTDSSTCTGRSCHRLSRFFWVILTIPMSPTSLNFHLPSTCHSQVCDVLVSVDILQRDPALLNMTWYPDSRCVQVPHTAHPRDDFASAVASYLILGFSSAPKSRATACAPP